MEHANSGTHVSTLNFHYNGKFWRGTDWRLEYFGAFWGILGAEEAATERLKSLTPTPPLFCHFQKPRLTPVKEGEGERDVFTISPEQIRRVPPAASSKSWR